MLDNLYLLTYANFDTPNESIVMYTIVLRHEFVGQAKFMYLCQVLKLNIYCEQCYECAFAP